jgi:hypothetical protein
MVDNVILITIPGDPNELSPNARFSTNPQRARMAQTRLVKEWRTKGRLLLQNALAGLSWRPERVRVSFTVRRARSVDYDNLCSSLALKALQDSMVDVGIVPNDTPAYVERGLIVQDTGRQWKDFPEVVMLIQEAEL